MGQPSAYSYSPRSSNYPLLSPRLRDRSFHEVFKDWLLRKCAIRQICTVLLVVLSLCLMVRTSSSITNHHRVPHLRTYNQNEIAALTKPNATTSREAYVLYYTGASTPIKKDHYFNCTRRLIYQLRIDPNTRDRTRDAVVIIPRSQMNETLIPQKIERLKKDGAIIRVVDDIRPSEEVTKDLQQSRISDNWTKLQFFQLVEYERIMVIDTDVLLRKSMKGIWDDPSTQVRPSVSIKKNFTEIELALGEDKFYADKKLDYVMAVWHAEVDRGQAKYLTYFGGSFYVTKPSLAIHKFMIDLIPHGSVYDPYLAEQNILNYIFRNTGPLPSTLLPEYSHCVWPELKDFKLPWYTWHGKHWVPEWEPHPPEVMIQYVKPMYLMEGYYMRLEGRDEL